jgi:hypothetical protein
MHRFQAATYSRLTPGANGKGRIDTLVKTKIPQVVSQSFEITDGDLAAIQSLYPFGATGYARKRTRTKQVGGNLLAAELCVLAELRARVGR